MANLPVPFLFAFAFLVLTTPLSADGPPWVPLGPSGGQVVSLALHPTNPAVLYATVPEGRVYKSVNAGASWVEIGGLNNVSEVAIEPSRPTTVYARTPDQLFKSVNGGATWALASPRGLSTNALLMDLAVDPFRPSRLYLGTWLGEVWRSDNGGASWRFVSQGLRRAFGEYIRALAVSRQSGMVFAATRTGLYRTQDAGGLWTRVRGGLPDGEILTVVVSPSDPRYVYAILESGIYHSRDGGASWAQAATPTEHRVTGLAVHPRFPSTLFAISAAGGLYRSKDFARTWTLFGPSARTDVRTVAIHSRPVADTIYVGTAPRGLDTGGVQVSTDGGAHWTVRNRGLRELTTVTVAADAADALLAGTRTQGLFRLANPQGLLWSRTNAGFPPPSPAVLLGDVVNAGPGLFFAVANGALWRTEDAGVSWTKVSDFAGNLMEAAADPETPGIAYTMTLEGLFRTQDAGASWTSLTRPPLDCVLQNLALAPSLDGRVLYATGMDGSLSPCQNPVPRVFRSRDGGASWENVSAGLPGQYAGALAVDPLDPNVAYVGIEASSIAGPFGLWKTVDGGATWTRTDAPLGPVQDVVVSSVPGRVYAVIGFSTRIYRSDDGGATWRPWDEGIGADIHDLATDPGDPGRLYAATDRGVWMLEETD